MTILEVQGNVRPAVIHGCNLLKNISQAAPNMMLGPRPVENKESYPRWYVIAAL
jgi:hypothetical protein